VTWTETGEFSALDTARRFPFLMSLFLKQINLEIRYIRRFDADRVLSDSVLSTVLAGKLARKKVVTLINQLRLESSQTTPHWARQLLTAGSIAVPNELWNLSDGILLPDLPPPYTISERNLWSAGRIAKRCRYIGFLVPGTAYSEDHVTRQLAEEKKLKIYWQISGPEATKPGLQRRAIEISSMIRDRAVSVIALGRPTGSITPRKTDWGWIYEWCEVKDRLLDLADIVVSRSGHTTVAQFIKNSKASILVPIPKQAEQEGNASKADKLGIAVKIPQSALNLDSLTRAAERLQNANVASKLTEISSIANRYNPVAEIVSELND
jgi:UDP:flavonoid glycosyltransferase YjiC (YdhE family)